MMTPTLSKPRTAVSLSIEEVRQIFNEKDQNYKAEISKPKLFRADKSK